MMGNIYDGKIEVASFVIETDDHWCQIWGKYQEGM